MKKGFPMKNIRVLALAAAVSGLSACGGGSFSDLDAYMADEKAKPSGRIKPIPAFKAYKTFNYSAAGMRSPFQKPVNVKEIVRRQSNSNVKPDENRTREFLEQYSVDSLSMVGTLEQDGTLWALMQDRAGGIHRITAGNYMGRNHGRVVEATPGYVALIEIVSDGVDGWVERPRTIKLKSKK